jgi:DNA (cytosine-5)-methyltransferase 1
MKPLLVDLFCCAGGASMGYHQAGYEVIGVDLDPQPHYPFEFYQGDALELTALWDGPASGVVTFDGRPVSAIHASPPCQSFSQAVKIKNRENYPDLIEPTRTILRSTGLPYVIENVPRAPLIDAIKLCGSSFGLPIRRHRKFESNVVLMAPPCIHGAYPRIYPPAWNRTTPLRVLSISGGYTGAVDLEEHKAAMGVDWEMTGHELSESIPPAYTRFIGEQLLAIARVSTSPGEAE